MAAWSYVLSIVTTSQKINFQKISIADEETDCLLANGKAGVLLTVQLLVQYGIDADRNGGVLGRGWE